MATPATAEDVQDAILQARADRRTLELVGGGSKAAIGAPGPADAVLDMSGLSGVIDYDPAELVLTARAGTPLVDIERLLEASGQMLAFEPMDHGPLLGGAAGAGTLGGMVAANASGPRRPTAGAARDHLLGFEAVSGRGDLFKAGGKVVKNVTGYDLPKLLAGSWGTLAALTAVTLKVLPAARSRATVLLHGLDDRAACEAMSLALGSASPVTAAAHLPAGCAGSAGAATVLRLEGIEPSIRTGIAALTALLGGGDVLGADDTVALWRHIRDVGPFCADDRPVWRIALPPADGWRLMATLSLDGADVFYDWAGGLVWLAAPPAAAAAVRPAVGRLGGQASLVRASAALRAQIAAFPPEPPALAALSQRVKAAFDPDGILNPRHRIGGAPSRAAA